MSLKNIALAIALFSVALLPSCGSGPTDSGTHQSDMTYALPAGMAWADGVEIRFAHTEVSDSAIAVLLTNMMTSPVLHVPSLALVADTLLANVYVFANGIKGMGPLNHQADVFDNPPGSPGYTPLRRLQLVSWKDTTAARLLKSKTEITAAVTAGEVTVEKQPVVINMPFIVWANGKR